MYEIHRHLRILQNNSPMVPAQLFGPEVLINGDFSSSVGWTLNGTAIISGGVLQLPLASSAERTTFNETIIPTTYRAMVDVISTDGTNLVLVNIGGVFVGIPGSNTNGKGKNVEITTTAEEQIVSILSIGATLVLDNFSVKRTF